MATGCSSPFGTRSSGAQSIPEAASPSFQSLLSKMQPDSHLIKHVVVIVQENRTVDNLFNGLQGADTVQFGKNKQGQTVQLREIPLTAPYDISHKHSAFMQDYDNGKMDGFNTETENCYSKNSYRCPQADVASYAYVRRSDVEPYFDLASRTRSPTGCSKRTRDRVFPRTNTSSAAPRVISDSSNLNGRRKSHRSAGAEAPGRLRFAARHDRRNDRSGRE